MPDLEITCETCNQVFTLDDAQQAYYTENCYTLPTRCDACEKIRREEKEKEKAARKPRRRRRW